MKTYLSFNNNSQDDREKLKEMLQAANMRRALWEIKEEIFRPARKHGYAYNSELNGLLEKDGVVKAIGLLEKRFYEILKEEEVTLD